MKYIATAVTGYALMTRDIEVEIDEAKLEAALEENAHNEDNYYDKPADEWWIDIDFFSDYFRGDDDKIKDKADAIVEEWEALPDCVKVRDHDTEQVNDWENEPHIQACQAWLRSKGWAPLPDCEDGIWFRKK